MRNEDFSRLRQGIRADMAKIATMQLKPRATVQRIDRSLKAKKESLELLEKVQATCRV